MPVIVCGMAGARHGWQEVPYRTLPARPVQQQASQIHNTHPMLNVYILSGVADVMRGEETQIAGILTRQADFSGVVC